MIPSRKENLLGTGLPLVKASLQLNKDAPAEGPPITEVVTLFQNSPETGVRDHIYFREAPSS